MTSTDRGDAVGAEGHSSLAQAVNQLKKTVYAVCDMDTTVHDVTTWVHNCLVGRKRGCVWVLSDPYIQLVVDHWRGVVNDRIDHGCPMYRHVIIECIRGEHQLRYVPASSPVDRIRDIGLRAPSCLDTRQRMGITRSVGKEWSNMSRPFKPSARFVVVNEYTWLHLPVPIDILRYRFHLAAPSGWWSTNEIPKMVLTKNPIDQQGSDCEGPDNDTVQRSLNLRATSQILEYLRSHLDDKARSILCSMHLVSTEYVYDCMAHFYGNDGIDLEEYMHAHFECPEDGRGDDDEMATTPSHLRLRRTGIHQCVDKGAGGLHASPVAFSLISLTFGSPQPGAEVASDDTCTRYRRLIYMARLVYCSQSFRVRYQAVSMDMGRLFLPFAGLYGVSTPVHSIGSTTVVLRPFGWPVAIRLDHDAAIPSVVWCEDTQTLSHEEIPCRLHPGSNVRDIEEVYKASLFVCSMKESLGLQICSNDNAGSLLTVGGRFVNGEDSIQHQHLCLVILLLVTCPLCYLDEAVSVATVVLCALVGDSRTFHVSQLPYLREAHMRAWLRYWENADNDEGHRPTPVDPIRQADARQHEDAVVTKLLHHPDDRRAFRRPIVVNAKNNTVTRRRTATKPPDPTTTHRGRYRCCNVPKEYLAGLHHASTLLKELSRKKRKSIILDGDDGGLTHPTLPDATQRMILKDSPGHPKKTNRKKVYQRLVSRTEDALKYRLARQRCRLVTLRP